MIQDNGSFSLFDPEWTASEEHVLIDSVEQYGLGNWEDVGANLPMKRVKDVEAHYLQVYIDSYLGRITVPEDIPNRMTDHTPPIHGRYVYQKFSAIPVCDSVYLALFLQCLSPIHNGECHVTCR